MSPPGAFTRLAAAIIIIAMADLAAPAQSTSGIPGYMRIPTATFMKDGTLFIGSSFLPARHLAYTNYNYNAATAFVSLTFLPFLEVDFRFTRQLGLPSYDSHVSDRMPSVRLRIIREKRWYPSIVIGIHDFLTSIEGGPARHFESSYIVISKGFPVRPAGMEIEATLGYGTNWMLAKNHELTGFFGGFSLRFAKVNWLRMMADYDGNIFSAGIEAVCFRRLFLKAGTAGFDSFTGCISYHIFLKR